MALYGGPPARDETLSVLLGDFQYTASEQECPAGGEPASSGRCTVRREPCQGASPLTQQHHMLVVLAEATPALQLTASTYNAKVKLEIRTQVAGHAAVAEGAELIERAAAVDGQACAQRLSAPVIYSRRLRARAQVPIRCHSVQAHSSRSWVRTHLKHAFHLSS